MDYISPVHTHETHDIINHIPSVHTHVTYDIAIIGAGTAGLTAAIYGARAGLNVLLLEKKFPGGQIVYTQEVANFPGYSSISGADFANNLVKQVKDLSVEIAIENVVGFDLNSDVKTLTTNKREIKAKTVIIAVGATHKKLECKGETQFTGKGMSYCAVCDGMMFAGKDVCVVGGGNTAFEEVLYLSDICKTVYLIHRSDKFRADKINIEKVSAKSNVKFKLNCTVIEIAGNSTVNKVILSDDTELNVSGVFAAIGLVPQTEIFANHIDMDKYGYISSDESCKTNIPGVFIAGDCRTKSLRQLITAASDGAIAATNCKVFL